MPRIRSVHPGQWTDEEFVEASAFARLLCLGLRNESDDNGIFEWKPKTLKMRILPADNVDIEALLQELLDHNQVMRYEVDGKPYGMIRNFLKFQRPEKPKFFYPIPDIELPKGYALHPKYSTTGTPSEGIDSESGRQPVADESPKSNSEGSVIGKERGKGKEKDLSQSDKLKRSRSDLEASENSQTPQPADKSKEDHFKINDSMRFDIVPKLSETALNQAKKIAFSKGWDIYALTKIYNDGVAKGTLKKPKYSADAAFTKWVDSFTASQPPP